MNEFSKKIKEPGLTFMTFETFSHYLETEQQTPTELFGLVTEAGIKVVVFGDEMDHEDPKSLHIVTNINLDGKEVTSSIRETTDEEIIAFNTEAASLIAKAEERKENL